MTLDPCRRDRLVDRLLIRFEVEDFLNREAAMLDEWRLDDWLALFTDPCDYEVTAPNIPHPETASRNEFYFLIGDDRARLEHRIKRMKNPGAHVEWPRSKTRHVYSNLIVDEGADGSINVQAAFITLRTKRGTVFFFGKILFHLERSGDSFLIRSKRVIMDIDSLAPQGRVSIFL